MGAERQDAVRVYRMSARATSTAETGERILAAAAEAFGEGPYDQVSLDSIAAAAAVTVRTVVRRFGSKDQLFAEVAARRASAIRSARDEAVPGDTAGAIRILVNSYEEWGGGSLHFLAHESRAPLIAEVASSGRRYHDEWVARVFGPLLPGDSAAARRSLAELRVATDVYAWKILRRDLGLGRRAVEETMLDLVERILAPRTSGRS